MSSDTAYGEHAHYNLEGFNVSRGGESKTQRKVLSLLWNMKLGQASSCLRARRSFKVSAEAGCLPVSPSVVCEPGSCIFWLHQNLAVMRLERLDWDPSRGVGADGTHRSSHAGLDVPQHNVSCLLPAFQAV